MSNSVLDSFYGGLGLLVDLWFLDLCFEFIECFYFSLFKVFGFVLNPSVLLEEQSFLCVLDCFIPRGLEGWVCVAQWWSQTNLKIDGNNANVKNVK